MKKTFFIVLLSFSNLIFSQIKLELTHAIYKDSISLNIINDSEEKVFLFIDNPVIDIPNTYMHKLKKEISFLSYKIYTNDSILDCDYILKMHKKIPVFNNIGIIISNKKITFKNISILEYTENCFSKKEHYDIQLYFKQDAKFVKKRLSKKEIKYLKQNNIKIFDGIIYSNKIPLIVKFGEIEN